MAPNTAVDAPIRPFVHRGHTVDPAEILRIARAAGRAIMEIYCQDPETWDVQMKAGNEPLTRADCRSHEIIRDGLAAAAPLALVSEEGAHEPYEIRKTYESHWCVDPLDGTKEFLKRNGQFTVNIALVDGSQSIFGVVTAPALGLEFMGGPGMGAWKLRGGAASAAMGESEFRPQATDPIHQLGDSAPPPTPEGRWTRMEAARFSDEDSGLVLIGSRSHASEASRKFISTYKDAKVMELGSSLKFMYVAEGTAHVYPRLAPTSEWDTCAADAILRAAGGTILQAEGGSPAEAGQPVRYNKESLLSPFFVAVGARRATP